MGMPSTGRFKQVRTNYAEWNKLVKKLNVKFQVQVGVVGSQASTPVEPGSPLNMAGLATIHEYGAPSINIPERAPIRKTFAAKVSQLKQLKARLAKKVIEGNMTMREAHEAIGMYGAAEVKKTIIAGVDPPNAPSTIERKGSSKPLIHHGRLLNAYTHLVKEGD